MPNQSFVAAVVTLLFSASTLASTWSSAPPAPGPSLCAESGAIARAQASLDAIKAQLSALRPDLLNQFTSTQITTCNPTSVYMATWDPSQLHPQFMLPNVCGAQLLFVGEAEKEVSQFILNHNLQGYVCVDQLRATPFPAFSSGN